MSSYTKESYIGYIGPSGDKFGVKIKVLHTKANPWNMNKLDHIDYVANAFAYIINLQAYYCDRHNRQYSSVIVSDEKLAENIGCHVNSSSRILKKLQKIFDLDFNRLGQRHGAREITINQRVIDFLKVYSLEDLDQYIDKYHLDGVGEFRALQQIYRYRVWGVKDTQLSLKSNTEKRKYLKRFKNFFHRLITNNRSEQDRINYVVANRQLISEYNNRQLDRIIQEKAEGDLSSYWLSILIKLEQKISLELRREEKAKQDQSNETEQHNTSLIESESKREDTVEHRSATQEAQRIPELDPNDYAMILVEWNNMILNQDIPQVDELNREIKHAIDTQVKSNGKAKVISCIRKISALEHKNKFQPKMTFKRFMQDKTIETISKLPITEDVDAPWFTRYIAERNGIDIVDPIDHGDIPHFETFEDVASWWNTRQ